MPQLWKRPVWQEQSQFQGFEIKQKTYARVEMQAQKLGSERKQKSRPLYVPNNSSHQMWPHSTFAWVYCDGLLRWFHCWSCQNVRNNLDVAKNLELSCDLRIDQTLHWWPVRQTVAILSHPRFARDEFEDVHWVAVRIKIKIINKQIKKKWGGQKHMIFFWGFLKVDR